MASYNGGRIKKITIRNFMTYDHVEINAKEGLNLIVGLNGSGKSSIMCAICLGLAGKPQFTGRATQLSDFIKHGCKEAEIKMELESGHKNNISICRRLKGEKCEWFLNNSACTQNDIVAAVKKFNIDTSNLCQFLPQEKVVEFSRMDKKQRLENMLQAIGEPHLFNLFNELKELHKKCSDIENDVKKHQSNKNSAEAENDRISDEVQKQESRVRLRKELAELYVHKKLLTYQSIREDVQQLKVQVKSQEMELGNIYREKEEAVAHENSIIASYMKYSQKHSKFRTEKKNLIDSTMEVSNHLTTFNEEVEKANIEYKNKLEEVEGQKKMKYDVTKQIEAREGVIAEKKIEYQKSKEKEPNLMRLNLQVQKEISSLWMEIEKLSAEKNHLDYSIKCLENQLASLRDEDQKKMENLRRCDKHAYEAACWLRKNKNRFNSNIYHPIMLEIKVHSSAYCKYIENTIPFRDMIAFLCEDKNDLEVFQECVTQLNLKVNLVMSPTGANFASPPLTLEHKNCNLQCYVSDLFSAPDPIMRYLCACFGVHRIPVARNAVPPNKIDFILNTYTSFFSGNQKIIGIRSKYGDRNLSVKRDSIMERNLLMIHNDDHQTNVEQQLQNAREQSKFKSRQIEELKANRDEKESYQEKLRQEIKSIQNLKEEIDHQQNIINQKKDFLKKSYVIDVNEEKQKVARKIQSINEHRETTLIKLNRAFKQFIQLENEIIKVILCMNTLSKTLKLTKASNEEIHDKVKAVEIKLQSIKKEYGDKKLIGHKLLGEIQALGGEFSKINEDSDITSLRYTAEEVELKINHIQAQLNVDEDNESLVTEYKSRKRKIENLQQQIEDFQFSLNELKKTVQEKKEEWLNPLQHHIGNINKKFSHYFEQLSCAGEISLDIPEDSDEFMKYGLQIKLKFHDDEPLTDLSQTHHSGGECSVAAIVFILSLQELTEVPFRCIDEINQGMDSVNERKIYQLIADSVREDKCSQYFLLTPKLLMDLKYPENVAVHIIFNSCFLNIKLDLKKHLKIAKSA